MANPGPRSFDILLAEDNQDDAVLMRQAFRRAHLPDRLHIVSDGEDAMAYLAGTPPYNNRKRYPFPDFVIVDVNMPRRDGMEVLKAMRKDTRFSHVMIHMLSITASATDVRRSYRNGANSFLVKPSRLDDLVELVKTLHNWHTMLRFPAGERVAGAIPRLLQPESLPPQSEAAA